VNKWVYRENDYWKSEFRSDFFYGIRDEKR